MLRSKTFLLHYQASYRSTDTISAELQRLMIIFLTAIHGPFSTIYHSRSATDQIRLRSLRASTQASKAPPGEEAERLTCAKCELDPYIHVSEIWGFFAVSSSPPPTFLVLQIRHK